MNESKMKKAVKILGGVAAGIGAAAPAMATGLVDVSAVTLDTAALGTIGGLVIAGLASIWGFRKIVKSINRS